MDLSPFRPLTLLQRTALKLGSGCQWSQGLPGVLGDGEERMNIERYWREMRVMSLIGVWFAGACLAVECPCAFGQVSDDDMALGRVVLAGHSDSRMRLHSGVFRATGRRQNVSRKHDINTDVDVRIFSAFDYASSRLRFDREEDPWHPRTAPNTNGGKFVRTPTQVLLLPPKGRSVTVRGPETKPLEGVNPFDVRTVGSVNLRELEADLPFDRLFGPSSGFMTDDRIVAVLKAGDVVQITWDFAASRIRRDIWFKMSDGYSPIRLEERTKKASGDGYYDPVNVSEASWSLLANVWVPSTFSVSRRAGLKENPDNPGELRSYQLHFEWDQINEGVDERLFTADSFKDENAAPIRRVVDARLNTPIVIKGETPRVVFTPAETAIPNKRSRITWSVLIVNGCVLGLVLAFVFRRRKK